MRMPTYILAIAACVSLTGCKEGLVIKGRSDWIEQQLPRVLAFRPSPGDAGLAIERQGDPAVRIRGHEGLVRLAEGEWFFFTMCSSHTELPDIVLVIDSRGRLFACNGHVCPDLILSWPRDHPPADPPSLADIVAGRVALQTGHKGAETWVRVDEWKDTNQGRCTLTGKPRRFAVRFPSGERVVSLKAEN